MLNTLEIFVSYSHEDEGLRRELESHLAFLKRNGNMIWHDRMIPAGNEWEGIVDSHLNSAHIILLLISSDFLVSRYCFDIEFRRAIERHNAQEAVVIPIILREVFGNGENLLAYKLFLGITKLLQVIIGKVIEMQRFDTLLKVFGKLLKN